MEYKILLDFPEEVQKVLNQWRHTYNINFIHVSDVNADSTYPRILILLKREKKNE